ncbi:MAG TPA: Lrp/AsnC family transcriptional regulator [Candidatus Lokiarchaeia archaeon]|nr:Lrp/AsnC family transcriptional regulator [Candidatus Lokiarchaeia archaeon]
MDETDLQILEALQSGEKTSFRKIAADLNLAPSTVHARVGKMKKEGIIKTIAAIVDPLKVGYHNIANLGLNVESFHLEDVIETLATYENVLLVTTASGDHNIILQVVAPDEKTLWHFITYKIRTLEGVHPQIHVSTFLTIHKWTHVLDLRGTSIEGGGNAIDINKPFVPK